MRPGDELVDINGNSVEGLNGEEATSLIRKVVLDFGCKFVTASSGTKTAAKQGNAEQGPNEAKHGQAKRPDPRRLPLNSINNNAAG